MNNRHEDVNKISDATKTNSKPYPKTKQTQSNDSMTRVYSARTHGFGVWGNRRVVMSVRVDEKLKKQATKVLKAIFGSTCRGIETYLAGLVATYEQQGVSGVYPSNTITIENLNVQRNLRSRRKLVVEEETEVAETKPIPRRRIKRRNFDFSKYSLEQLERKLECARQSQDVVATQFLAFEIKRRLVA